jgi:two-component system sensor histidine kinase FlrB
MQSMNVESRHGARAARRAARVEPSGVRIEALLSALPGGVLMLDADGAIRECNAAAAELLAGAAPGVRFDALLPRRRPPGSATGELIELAGARCATVTRRPLAGGGELVLIADVTPQHRMQRLLARQQRLLTLGELAAGLAHQIRTPLAAALLYASQMTLPDRTPESLARCAEKTAASLRQLDRLVTEMLSFAHGGAEREPVSVSALLEQVAQWVRPVMRDGVTLTIRTEAPKLSVRANASALASAVMNLAINALQASEGRIAIELLAREGAAGRAQIVVRDDGPGVPPNLRERLFEPFFTTRAGGNGIGLSIVKSVVDAHQGSVRLVDSPAGATFVIDLPAESPA